MSKLVGEIAAMLGPGAAEAFREAVRGRALIDNSDGGYVPRVRAEAAEQAAVRAAAELAVELAAALEAAQAEGAALAAERDRALETAARLEAELAAAKGTPRKDQDGRAGGSPDGKSPAGDSPNRAPGERARQPLGPELTGQAAVGGQAGQAATTGFPSPPSAEPCDPAGQAVTSAQAAQAVASGPFEPAVTSAPATQAALVELADLRARLAETEAAHEKELERVRAESLRMSKDAAARQALARAGAHDPDLALAALSAGGVDPQDFELDGSGGLSGFSASIKALQEEKGFLFRAGRPVGTHLPGRAVAPTGEELVDRALSKLGY